MMIRFLEIVGIIGSLSVLWLGWLQYKRYLINSIHPRDAQSNKPALLFFTANYCAPCEFQQAPIVERLIERWQDTISVNQYDVSQYPDLARQFKILTVPTTVVLDRHGNVTHINYGVASQDKLEKQLF